MKIRISFLVLCIFVCACKKQSGFESRLYGTVLNAETSANIHGASVVLSQQVISNGALNANWQTIASQSTSSGSYDFTFERENAAAFKMEVSHDLYFDHKTNINPDNLRTGEELRLNIYLHTKAYLKVSITNENPIGDEDEIIFTTINADFDCDCCDDEEIELIGPQIDTTWTCPLPGYNNLVYRYEVHKDTAQYLVFDTLYISPFDTSYINILY